MALAKWTFGRAEAPSLDRRDPRVLELARLAIDASAPVRLRDAEQVRALLGGSAARGVRFDAAGTRRGSLYALPLLTDSGRAIGSVTLLSSRTISRSTIPTRRLWSRTRSTRPEP